MKSCDIHLRVISEVMLSIACTKMNVKLQPYDPGDTHLKWGKGNKV